MDNNKTNQYYLEDFRFNMKLYRERLGLSQTDLAIASDCGTGTIGGIESGKAKPSFDMIIKIAEGLNVHPADLFKRDVTKSKADMKKELINAINKS